MEYKILPPSLGGLNLRDHPAYLQDTQCLTLHNFFVSQTCIKKRLGYLKLGDTLEGTGMELINFVDGNGLRHLLAFTTKFVYEYDSSDDEWDIKNEVIDDADLEEWSNDDTYAIGDYVKVIGEVTTCYYCLVEHTTTPEGDDFATALAAGKWEEAVYYRFTGDKEDRFSHTLAYDSEESSWPSYTALVVSNNKDKPQYYTGTGTFEELPIYATDFPDFAYTLEVDSHYSHLLFYSYTDTVLKSRNVIWTNFGRAFDDAVVGDDVWSLVGTAGEQYIAVVKGAIMRVKPLRNQRIIYTGDGIAIQSYVGGSLIYTFDEAVNELGLIAPKAIWDFSLYHFFLGTDQKIYLYSGGSELIDISQLLYDQISKRLSFAELNAIVFAYNRNEKRLYIFYPSIVDPYNDEFAQSYFSLNMNTEPYVWEEGRFAHSIRDFSIYENTVEYRCSSNQFTDIGCDDAQYAMLRCNEASLRKGFPVPIFLSDDGQVFRLEMGTGEDDEGNLISCEYETKDIVVNQGSQLAFFRPVALSINCCNKRRAEATTQLTIKYSIDQGETWTEFPVHSPITLTETWTTHTLEFNDCKTRQVRIKCSETSNGDVQIADMTLHYQLSTARE